MDFIARRSYRGSIKGVILDWAGTTVDFGSFAPTAVFLRLFKNHGVTIQVEHARRPMGLMKKDHLRAIFAIPEVSLSWLEIHGKPYSDEDVDALFKEFVPMQINCLKDYAGVIPGVVPAIAEFRRMGIKVGSTTGYTREMMDVLVPASRESGYEPDAWVSADDTPAGRPYPWMCYQNAMKLGIFPMAAMVKIGDTLADIEEGLNAGMWTIGLSLSGNLLGLTEEEYQRLSKAELQQKRQTIAPRLYEAGAHYVVDGLWDCLPVLEDIQRHLSNGDKP